MENTREIVYVTALYSVTSTLEPIHLLKDFLPFIKSKMKIILFTDIDSLSIDSVTRIFLPKTEIKSFSGKDLILPENHNPVKDTMEFLQLMNAKTEFIYRAKEKIKARSYVWFDFGILKIIKDRDAFIKNMENISKYAIDNKVVTPGCISKESVNFGNLFSSPIWRFCGGFFIVSSLVVENFYKLHLEEVEKCNQLNKITWEVNLFACIEKNNPDLFHWYLADHNDTIIPQPVAIEKKVMLICMIKNESSIIRRCIESALKFCDALCIFSRHGEWVRCIQRYE
jgi:hypothetical protein